ncbi:MAG: ribose 5-phosphate isomerase B [Anaerolineaceae bacterium]|nr:ribose 5-phosphate isomerase B [Anaerolineaceae bacterium]
MKIAVATDHGGFPLKQSVIETIESLNHEVLDFGTNSEASVDFPDFVKKACQAVQNGSADRAIVMCGSGVGACIAANKMKGIYAAICHDVYSAHQGVEHDQMNTLCLGGRIIGTELSKDLVSAFLSAEYFSGEKYQRRFDKIRNLEEEE